MRVFIGYDKKEHEAAVVAEKSLRRNASCDLDVTTLDVAWLQRVGLMWRTFDRRERIYDFISNANCSTEFSISRFLVPVLCPTGYALFVDSDVVFEDDIAKLMLEANPSKAVQVVKHQYTPREGTKMDAQVQTAYAKKNWSSVILWNCDHPANRRLTLHDVNTRRGLELHQFYWLADEEIGELSPGWNWLIGEQPKPNPLRIAHFTLGGPFIKDWIPREHDELWHRAAAQ